MTQCSFFCCCSSAVVLQRATDYFIMSSDIKVVVTVVWTLSSSLFLSTARGRPVYSRFNATDCNSEQNTNMLFVALCSLLMTFHMSTHDMLLRQLIGLVVRGNAQTGEAFRLVCASAPANSPKFEIWWFWTNQRISAHSQSAHKLWWRVDWTHCNFDHFRTRPRPEAVMVTNDWCRLYRHLHILATMKQKM